MLEDFHIFNKITLLALVCKTNGLILLRVCKIQGHPMTLFYFDKKKNNSKIFYKILN